MDDQDEKTAAFGLGGHQDSTPQNRLVSASGTPVKRRAMGRYAENEPDADGVWRKPAPYLRPCRVCGELTILLTWCDQCRAWAALVERVMERHALLH